MPLVTNAEILLNAQAGGYAVPAVNIANYETVMAVIRAAEQEKAPVILQVFKRLVDNGDGRRLAPMALDMIKRSDVPIALHLDHGDSMAQVEESVDCGFTSVMLDASSKPLAENVSAVCEAVKFAKPKGVSVEAELGHVPAKDGSEVKQGLTDPDEAAEFISATGVDALAVAIGTAHGNYAETPVLDFDRLEKIRKIVDTPLVLHGGSGTPHDALKKCVELGVCKINIATEFQTLFLDETKKYLAEGGFKPVDVFMVPVVESLVEFVAERLRLFGAAGRAS